MKLPALAVLTALVLLGSADAAAADCAGELTANKPAPTLPLPSACRAMGPLHLGMSYARMAAATGTPDTDATPAVGYLDAVYVFPRDLAAQLKRHPVPQADVHYGYVEVVFHDDRSVVISVVVTDQSVAFPYSVGGIAIDEPIDQLLRRVKAHHAWNATRDHVGFYPYPIGVDVEPDGRVFGIDISNDMRPNPGHAIRLHWVTDPGSGLVRGYHVTAGRLRSYPGPSSAATL